MLIKATLREGTEPSRCCGREFDTRKKCCSIVFCERQEGVRRRYWASQPFILRSVSCLQSLQKLLCRGVRMLISYPFLLCAAPPHLLSIREVPRPFWPFCFLASLLSGDVPSYAAVNYSRDLDLSENVARKKGTPLKA